MSDPTHICWYSDGAASAVAAKLMVDAGHPCRIIKTETNSEHPDNKRFRKEVIEWLGQPVEILHNKKYRDLDDCIEKSRFLRGPKGARCTLELKKKVRWNLEELDKIHVFGYTADKKDEARAIRLIESNPEYKIINPLIEQGITKADCLQILRKAGIKIPVMYELGFNNNNCLGCLKAETASYWLLTKKHFPEVFQKRAKQERELGYALCRINKVPVFLDELEQYLANRGKVKGQLSLDIPEMNCDFMCGEQIA